MDRRLHGRSNRWPKTSTLVLTIGDSAWLPRRKEFSAIITPCRLLAVIRGRPTKFRLKGPTEVRWLLEATFQRDIHHTHARRLHHLRSAYKTPPDKPFCRSGSIALSKLALEGGKAAMAHLGESFEREVVAEVRLHDPLKGRSSANRE